MCMKNLSLSLLLAMLICTDAYAASDEQRGIYFHRAAYTPSVLPRFEEVRGDLPSPIWDENPEWVELYWKAWEIGFKNVLKLVPNTGFVSNFIDTAFNGCIFMWDSSFMLMFGKYADRIFKFQKTLDNFYSHQHIDGFICREIEEKTGGGEPLTHARFIRDFRAICRDDWRLTAETSLAIPDEDLEIAMACLDEFIVDIKDTDPDVYRAYTTRENEQVLDNLRRLIETVGTERVLVRVPLIPSFNTEEHRARSKERLREMGVTRFDELTYKTDIKK